MLSRLIRYHYPYHLSISPIRDLHCFADYQLIQGGARYQFLPILPRIHWLRITVASLNLYCAIDSESYELREDMC